MSTHWLQVPCIKSAQDQLLEHTLPFESMLDTDEDRQEVQMHMEAMGITNEREGNALDVEVVCEIEQEVEQEVEQEQEVSAIAAVGSGLDTAWPLKQLASPPEAFQLTEAQMEAARFTWAIAEGPFSLAFVPLSRWT